MIKRICCACILAIALVLSSGCTNNSVGSLTSSDIRLPEPPPKEKNQFLGESLQYAPQTYTMKINPEKVREVIGKGGSVIQALVRETNTIIDLEDDGSVKIMAVSKEDADDAIARIKEIVAEPEVGQIYKGTVSGMKDFGLFVKIMNGFEAMVHISEITGERIAKIEDTKIKEGDTVYVRFMGADKRGKTRMSMVGIDQKTGEEIKK